MIVQSGNMSQADFIRTILERDARNIFRAQQLIVSQRIYLAGKDLKATRRQKGIRRRTGTLENSLASPDFIIQSQGEKFTMKADYPLYIRFLDMKHIGNWGIYRKPVWGILWNETYTTIRFKYGELISDRIGDALRDAFENYNKK